jgi:hypothetical protein
MAIIASQKTIAEASLAFIEDYCKESIIERKDQTNRNYWYYTAGKDPASANYILDYFQDPQEHGVSIDVTINAEDLIATYWKWETVDVCLPYENYQAGMTTCKYEGSRAPGFYYYYWTPQRQCVQQPPEITYRSIETSTISIWLEPTALTKDLLGTGPYFNDTNKPVLRYLYPDQWALVVVQPGERKIIEKPWFRNSADVEKFLKENKDFIILDTSAKTFDLTSRLPQKQSPATGKNGLSLYNFGINCDADLPGSGLLKGREVCKDQINQYTSEYGTKSFSIIFDRIPLDVPGTWYVGVSFYQWPAKYDGGRGLEKWGNQQYREFVFSDENMEKQFSFESYIIRSAPCNPEEVGNCWEE